MRFSQNEPGTWLCVAVVMIVLGAILAGAAEDPGVGRFLIGAGVVLGAVGLVMFAVRAGRGRS